MDPGHVPSGHVYEVTHGHWVIGPYSRNAARVGFGVAHGIIRGAYTVENWYPATSPGDDKRWEFQGKPWSDASEDVGRHFRHLINSSGPGSQNPVRLFLKGG